MSTVLHSQSEAVPSDVSRSRRRLHASVPTVAVVAIAVAFVDGFWVTSLRGAVGVLRIDQTPFEVWLRQSTIMLALIVVAVVGALEVAHRWVGHHPRERVRLAAAAMLIVVFTTVLGFGELVVNAVHDYGLQAAQLETNHGMSGGHAAHTIGVASCDMLCRSLAATRSAHVRGVTYATGLLLITNVVLVVWSLALRGGRLWSSNTTRRRRLDRPSGAAS
jgi:hypothetical protein